MLKKILFPLVFLYVAALPCAAQENVTLSGYIKDAATGEEIIGATLFVKEIGNGAVTNPYGFYSLTLPAGVYQITVRSVGYQPVIREVNLQANTQLNLELNEETTELQEVVVEARDERENVLDMSIGKNEINIKQVKDLPALFGEPDIIKMVQMQPGVVSAGEGTSAFFVRGGSADQNLILLDEAPVYDPSHFFGLFSVFNADVIKSADLYKGGIPPQFGGRLSSMLDVRTKDGNSRKFGGSAAIGLLASKFMLEGPIAKDKSSFIVSGRRSYIDVLSRLGGEDIPVYFYDLNAKVNWKPNNNNRFFIASYSGRDRLSFDDGGIDWGNQTTTMRWNHLFNEKLFSNLSVIFSNFDYKVDFDDELQGFEWTASMQELAIKNDMSWFINPRNQLDFGVHATYRRFSPGRIEPTGTRSIFTRLQLDRMHALDYALFISNTQTISDKLSIDYGLRYSIFQNTGEGTINEYADPQDNINPEVINERSYGMFEPIKTFHNLEPRFMARYILDPESSVKFSYQRMVQYVHLVNNSTVPIPFNTWAPSGPYLDPQKSDQVALGYYRNLQDNMWEISAEIYYKDMRDVTDFADNAQIFFNEDIATEYRQGTSDSYGLELMLKKTKGRLTGFATYTLSRTDRTVPGVNMGNPFPANYDRRHSFSTAVTYQLTDRHTLGGNWLYSTGRPITLPTGRYQYKGYQVDYYSDRNGYRLADFHRLDLSLTIDSKKNAGRSWKVYKTFSVYNVYNRFNPFTIYTRTRQDEDGEIVGDGTEREARKVALFPVLPSFTWRIDF